METPQYTIDEQIASAIAYGQQLTAEGNQWAGSGRKVQGDAAFKKAEVAACIIHSLMELKEIKGKTQNAPVAPESPSAN